MLGGADTDYGCYQLVFKLVEADLGLGFGYGVALGILYWGLVAVDVGGGVIEDDGEDEEVVVGGPRPGSPVGEVAIDEQKDSE